MSGIHPIPLIFYSYQSDAVTCNAIGSLEIETEQNNEILHSQEKVKFLISRDRLRTMQSSNFAISSLKRKITNNIKPTAWKSKTLDQFKNSFNNLKMVDGLIVKNLDDATPVVVSFPFLVEILFMVHNEMSHAGRHKILNVLRKEFWHPAIDKISREICASCKFCQLNKTNLQQIPPPILKVDAGYPFNLIAIDLIQFPKSTSGNNVALVVVDHYTKWLSAVPLKNKTGKSVANALRYRILPNLPRIPDRVLSDNGLEFTAEETENVFIEFGIKHIYSTPYSPASNGAVERANKSLKDLIKASTNDPCDWDKVFPKILVNYNNSYHSQIKCSPSDKILMKEYSLVPKIPLSDDVVETWREGHPNFSPFKLHQKVIRKIPRCGNLVSHKLKPRFEGPYSIIKVQSNGVSYELQRDNSDKIVRAHYRQLRPWRELPHYIQKYIDRSSVNDDAREDECNDSAPEISDSYSFEGFGLPYISSSENDLEDFDSSSTDFSETAENSLSDGTAESSADYTEDFDSSLHPDDILTTTTEFENELSGSSNRIIADVDVFQKSVLELRDLPCSEKTPKTMLHSTPNNNGLPFRQFIDQINSPDIFNILEQTLLIQEEVLHASETALSKLNASFCLAPDNNITSDSVHTAEGAGPSRIQVIPAEYHHLFPPNSPDNPNDFCGFDNNVGFDGFESQDGNRPENILNELKDIVAQGKRNLEEGRNRSTQFRRELWEYRQAKSIINCSSDSTKLGSLALEMSDYVADLRRSILRTPRRVLRSHGTVEHQPHVLSSPIEYRRKNVAIN